MSQQPKGVVEKTKVLRLSVEGWSRRRSKEGEERRGHVQ